MLYFPQRERAGWKIMSTHHPQDNVRIFGVRFSLHQWRMGVILDVLAMFCFGVFSLCWHLVLPKKCNTHFNIMCLSIIAILKTVLSHWWFTGQYLHLFTGNDVKSILLSIVGVLVVVVIVEFLLFLRVIMSDILSNQTLEVFKKRLRNSHFTRFA